MFGFLRPIASLILYHRPLSMPHSLLSVLCRLFLDVVFCSGSNQRTDGQRSMAMYLYLQRAHDFNETSLAEFAPGTNAGNYFSRRSERLAEYEPNVPVCESLAIENAATCNTMPLADSDPNCPLPPQCDSAIIRYYCKREREGERECRMRS